MPDPRRSTAFRRPLPERAPLLMRERQSSTDSSSGTPGSAGTPGPADDNPFAAPPENRPDQPWQPRLPSNTGNGGGNGEGSSEGGSSDDRSGRGGQWSSRQPGRQGGGFGGRPGGQGGPNGQGGSEGNPGGLRWDPTDPAQRRARYALLCGMWAFFFAIFDFPEIALLLGALAVYWSISSLRAKPGEATGRAGSAPAPGAPAGGPLQGSGSGHVPAAAPGTPGAPAVQNGGRQQTTAAISGLVTALIALSIVATTFTVQLVYRDYYTCVNDALTKSAQLACNDQLPKPLEPFFGVKN
ncbi:MULTISPECIES: hypothetical protein [unclassified Streptomyces]|uniref:hypothetical protein n=1 Tax=unclassified Streptomyces TaxID=2593676 RepID=UPI0011E898F4|nr:hypothetical protein [Streptomyces sp. sk2.1]TXS66874.1 hypothetical protein EAO76_28645 [Streptomyces sp. sk2.1]